MFKRILVAVDGSPASDQGLKSAVELAADQRASLTIVHVIDDLAITKNLDGGLFSAEHFDRIMDELRASGRALLAKAGALARERGLEAQTHLVEMFGQSVAQAIVVQAREQKADLLVLGTHGRRGLRRLVLGSDAESVLRDSPVPVLLVRIPTPAKSHVDPVEEGCATPTTRRPAEEAQSGVRALLR